MPIISSLLDTDAYKLHMHQAVVRQGLDVPTSYEFINRNKGDHIGKYWKEIRTEVDAMGDIFLTSEEYEYLLRLPYMKRDYLDYLLDFRFNTAQVEIFTLPSNEPATNQFDEDNMDLVIRFSGSWSESILFEVPVLAIVSEVVQRHRHPEVTVQDALGSLSRKLDEFVALSGDVDITAFQVCDFGSRRRFSKEVHEAVVKMLSSDSRFSQNFSGTSNYDMARRFNLRAFGTQAHEWFQAFQQIAPSLRDSQTTALKVWLKEYPHHLGIALTDCITMDAFLKDFDSDFANAFDGLRHDSGDPVVWGKKAVAHYKSLNIDPLTKTLIFSDGLNLISALILYKEFHDEISVAFGIGTQLTCSIDNVKAMNIVIKMVRCQHSPVAKVSDTPGKICCDDKDYVNALKQTFGVA